MEKQNAYSRPVTLGNILRFAVPTIVMSVFMSFYTMVDGRFLHAGDGRQRGNHAEDGGREGG